MQNNNIKKQHYDMYTYIPTYIPTYILLWYDII